VDSKYGIGGRRLLTNEQEEKILKWKGWKPNPDGNPLNLVWIMPNGTYRMRPNLDDLDFLTGIIESKKLRIVISNTSTSLWLVSIVDGSGDTLVQSIQQALLKLAEGEEK
jgi:hypothetical protein